MKRKVSYIWSIPSALESIITHASGSFRLGLANQMILNHCTIGPIVGITDSLKNRML